MFCNVGTCLKAYLFKVRESLRTMLTKYGKMCIYHTIIFSLKFLS